MGGVGYVHVNAGPLETRAIGSSGAGVAAGGALPNVASGSSTPVLCTVFARNHQATPSASLLLIMCP